jgi:hypothetical protein
MIVGNEKYIQTQVEILPVRGLYTIQNCSIYSDIHKKKTDSSKTI